MRREVGVDDALIKRLAGACDLVDTSDDARVAAGRDWWPLSMVWAASGVSPALPTVVARPAGTAEVSEVLRICNDASVPVTPFAGRSGVCGGSLPLFGGVSLDLGRLHGITEVDKDSLVVEVRAGTYGDDLEEDLRSTHGLTLGHWPQSIALSTVGGWLACRGAGQYSTRYGKIEDMVGGLEVVLASGHLVRTGAGAAGGWAPKAATGPDLTQVFVGSEGTLGVIVSGRLRAWPVPPHEERASWLFGSFDAGLDACRRILRRTATPAVLRLYDPAESARNFALDREGALLLVLDEGDPAIVAAVMSVVAEECAAGGAASLGPDLVGHWLEHRNNLPPLESLVTGGIVADTIEVAGSWTALSRIYHEAVEGLMAVEGTIAASAHQSHSYPGGGCLYFTFAGRPPVGGAEGAESYYRSAWEAVMSATTRGDGAISHHHGIGINRARFLPGQLGTSFEVLVAMKRALDPKGILNPGKLALPSPFGPEPWP
jgi:alkyldihydroxyacetonephosphate synthase